MLRKELITSTNALTLVTPCCAVDERDEMATDTKMAVFLYLQFMVGLLLYVIK